MEGPVGGEGIPLAHCMGTNDDCCAIHLRPNLGKFGSPSGLPN